MPVAPIGYHVAIAFIGAIRHTATPAPISARAGEQLRFALREPEGERAGSRDEQQHRLDAARTEAIEQHPAGICIAANATK